MEKNIFRESGKTPAELADLIDSLMDEDQVEHLHGQKHPLKREVQG